GADRSAERPPARAVSPYGEHQVGIARGAAAANELVAFQLTNGLAQLMRLWTKDIVELTGDNGLTVTVGFGPRVFELTGRKP
ncbi:hypothetical protein, partial [Streptomyces turgidiscabies]|uniref:hypothetical protein n=1 Tax=Streptomyces turgidiscabies TaxID=85558 RepID=UPI0038F7B64C